MPMINPERPQDEWTASHCFRSLEGNFVGMGAALTFTFRERMLFERNPHYQDVALFPSHATKDGSIYHGRLVLGYEDLYRRQILSVYDHVEKPSNIPLWEHIQEETFTQVQQPFGRYLDSLNQQ